MKKEMLRKLVNLLGRSNSIDLCDSFDVCDDYCDTCPFFSDGILDETINELQNMLDKEVEGGV